jgi:hypothetical protein
MRVWNARSPVVDVSGATHGLKAASGGYRPRTETAIFPELANVGYRDPQEAGIKALLSIARGQMAQSAAMSMQEIIPDLPDPPAPEDNWFGPGANFQ